MPIYRQIPYTILSEIQVVPCDVYIQTTATKHVKISNKNDEFLSEVLQKYYNKQIDLFYIREDESELFYDKYRAHLRKGKLDGSSCWKTTIKINAESIAVAHNLSKSLGISNNVVDSIDVITTNNIELLKNKDKNIFNHLNEMILGKNYFFERSMLISYICSTMAIKLGWDTEQNLQKLNYAALFHDISLNDEKLAKINFKNKKYEDLNKDEKKDYDSHPIQAAEYIKKFKNLPIDTDQLILQHHERPDGSGFPRKLSANGPNQFTCLFILAVDFATNFYNCWPDCEAVKVLTDDLFILYNTGNYRASVQALKTIIPDFSSGRTDVIMF